MAELKEYSLQHVNTGCLYEKEGQKITIIHGDRETHFIDHSRMVSGTIEDVELSAIQVVWKYVKGHYRPIAIEPYHLRYEFEKHYKTAEFEDISDKYKSMVLFNN